MDEKTPHYYIYLGKRYENMREVTEALGISSRAFRYKVKYGEILKITNNQNGQKRHETRASV